MDRYSSLLGKSSSKPIPNPALLDVYDSVVDVQGRPLTLAHMKEIVDQLDNLQKDIKKVDEKSSNVTINYRRIEHDTV